MLRDLLWFKTFEDLLDNRRFILKTDHMNLTYLYVTLTGKVHRWKLYLQDEDFHLCHVPGKEVHQFVERRFGNKEQPRLLRSQWTTEDIRLYMEYIIRVVRAEAYDTTVMEASMDEESIMYLQTLFRTTIVAVNNPIRIHWTEDWDVATILDALDELFSRRGIDGKLW